MQFQYFGGLDSFFMRNLILIFYPNYLYLYSKPVDVIFISGLWNINEN